MLSKCPCFQSREFYWSVVSLCQFLVLERCPHYFHKRSSELEFSRQAERWGWKPPNIDLTRQTPSPPTHLESHTACKLETFIHPPPPCSGLLTHYSAEYARRFAYMFMTSSRNSAVSQIMAAGRLNGQATSYFSDGAQVTRHVHSSPTSEDRLF
jgi:hypothetical protein